MKTWSKPSKLHAAAFGALAMAISVVAIVPSARAADPTCDQFKSRLVAAANALQQAGLSPPVITYVQKQDMGSLKVFEIAEGEADLYCRDSRFDSFDVIVGPIVFEPDGNGGGRLQPISLSPHAVFQFRYLVTAAIMAFTQQGAGEALKSLDNLVADVNAKRDANTVLESHAVLHLYGGDHFNFQINAADALYGSSPGEE